MGLMKARLVLCVLAFLLVGVALLWERHRGVRFAEACGSVVLGIDTNTIASLFHGRPEALYAVGQSGFQVVVYRVPWFRSVKHTTSHVLTNSQAFPLRHGAMVIVIDSGGNVVAYQRINESSFEWNRGAIPLAGTRDIRTLGELLDALIGQDGETPKVSAGPPAS